MQFYEGLLVAFMQCIFRKNHTMMTITVSNVFYVGTLSSLSAAFWMTCKDIVLYSLV